MKKAPPVLPWLIVAVLVAPLIPVSIAAQPNAVTFPSGEVVLHGDLYKPEGAGPSPGVIWYHGGGNPTPGSVEYRDSAQLGRYSQARVTLYLFPTGSVTDDRLATI